MLQHTAVCDSCVLCEGTRLRYLFPIGGRPLHQCDDCGFVFLNPPASANSAEGIRRNAGTLDRASLDRLARYAGKSSGRRVTLTSGDEAAGLSIESIDICVLTGALEHAPDPVALLRQVHRGLAASGTLCIVTPSLDSWSARWMKSRWPEFRPERLQYFDSQTIQSLLAKTGFAHIRIWPAGSSGVLVLARKTLVRFVPRLSIIVPVYNEKATVKELLATVAGKELPGVEKEIVIVESNSTDGTREEVLRYRNTEGVRLVLEDRPRGKGHAVRAGLEQATGEFILIQDGDLEYDINDYDELLAPLLKYQRAFVLGSRHIKGWKMREFTNQPLVALVMNCGQIVCTALLNLACGQRLKDPFTMYKVFRRDCLYGLTLKANRFDFDWELVIKLLRKGYRPLEIPVNYRSRSFKQGKKVSFFRDPLTWMWALVRFRLEPLYRDQ